MGKNKQPVIKAIPNGPYRFINIPFLINHKTHKPIDLPLKGINICRCGASKSLPFCDGRHSKIGFSTESQTLPAQEKEKAYRGEGITVHFDLSICAHVGICVRVLPKVFDIKKRPWIDPAKADKDALIALIRKCPSGALSYTVDGVRVDSFDSHESVEIVRNGPINVYGAITLEDDRKPKTKDHYSLCRCGKSGNRPFCDGAHLGKRFERVCTLDKVEEEGNACSP
jgi:CDGSH-type Zn-finger protein